MCGKYWVPSRERFITDNRENFIREAMRNDLDIIVDDMNLNPNTIKRYEDMAKDFDYDIKFTLFNTPLEECIERDSKRENPIGEKVIRETYNRYKNYLNGVE